MPHSKGAKMPGANQDALFPGGKDALFPGGKDASIPWGQLQMPHSQGAKDAMFPGFHPSFCSLQYE